MLADAADPDLVGQRSAYDVPLATQGSGDSPSLTIQALALRAAEALVERRAATHL